MIYPVFPFRLSLCMVFTCLLALGCSAMLPATPMHSPGSRKWRIEVAGENRSYRLYIPAGYRQDQPLPLVLVLHGAFSSAQEIERQSGFSALADSLGFIAAYPNGFGLLGWLRHWNAGFCCGRAMRAEWNDTGFLLHLIDALPKHLAIDRRRIYLVGLSNGGMLAQRLAVEYPERVAAVTVVAAAVGAQWKGRGEMQSLSHPALPVPVLIIHAKDDPVIPFTGGQSPRRSDVAYLGPQDAVKFWCSVNCCDPSSATTDSVPGGEWTRWTACRDGAEVALLALDRGGHAWPGAPSDQAEAFPAPDGATVAWQFMSQFSRP